MDHDEVTLNTEQLIRYITRKQVDAWTWGFIFGAGTIAILVCVMGG